MLSQTPPPTFRILFQQTNAIPAGPSVLPSSTVSLFTRQAKEDVDAYASHTGVDLDIEGGSSAHYAVFVNEIRSLASGASKK